MLVVISSEAPKKKKNLSQNGLHICRKNQISKSIGNKS